MNATDKVRIWKQLNNSNNHYSAYILYTCYKICHQKERKSNLNHDHENKLHFGRLKSSKFDTKKYFLTFQEKEFYFWLLRNQATFFLWGLQGLDIREKYDEVLIILAIIFNLLCIFFYAVSSFVRFYTKEQLKPWLSKEWEYFSLYKIF